MANGVMLGDALVLVTDEKTGKPVVETEPPEVPAGYETKFSWVESETEITQTWRLIPIAGTETEAALQLARIQAASLDDADALKVAALYDEWSGDGIAYEKGDRCRFQGNLVKCLQAHTSQPDWAPNAAPSLWALVLPGQEGSGVEVGIWQQPGSTNGYSIGDRVIHNGHQWESTANDNVWEPGAVGAPWTDLGEWESAGETVTEPTEDGDAEGAGTDGGADAA